MDASSSSTSQAVSPSERGQQPMPEPAMQAEESLSPRSLAATQGTDWVERVWFDHGLLMQNRDLNVQDPSGPDLNGSELDGRELSSRDINGSVLPEDEFQGFQSLAYPGRGLFGIPESPEPSPCLDWGAATALTVPCYATSHLSLGTSSRGHLAVLVGSVPPPPGGTHRYRVEAPEDQLPLLLTQLKEVYDVSIRALSFQGVLHLAALLLPGEGWEDFSPPPSGPLQLPLGAPVTSHRAGHRVSPRGPLQLPLGAPVTSHRAGHRVNPRGPLQLPLGAPVTSHRAGHRGPGARAAGARPRAEGRRERGPVPGKGKPLPEVGTPHSASEGPQKLTQSSRRPAGESSEEEVMGAFVRGWHCRPWSSPFGRRRHQARGPGALAPAPAAKKPPRAPTAASAAAAPAGAEASHLTATASAAAPASRAARALRPALATARRAPTQAPAPASSPAVPASTASSAPPLPPTRAPPPLARPPAAATPGAESPGQALLEGLAEGEAFCARVAQAADQVQYLLDASGRARGPGSGRIGASIVSLKALRSCVRLEIDVQMGPALRRDWVLFPLHAPGARGGGQAFVPWAQAGDEAFASWAQPGEEATAPVWAQLEDQAPPLWGLAGDQAFAPQAQSGDQASAPGTQTGDESIASTGALVGDQAAGSAGALAGNTPRTEASPQGGWLLASPNLEAEAGRSLSTDPPFRERESTARPGSNSNTQSASGNTEAPSGDGDPSSSSSTEPPSVSTEPPRGNKDPPSVSTEPPSVSTEPPSTSTEPPSISTDPPSGKKDPSSVSTESPSDNSEPPALSPEAPRTPQEPLHAAGREQGYTGGIHEPKLGHTGSSGHTSGSLETGHRYTGGSLEISEFLERCKGPLASPPLGPAPRTGLPPVHPPQAYPPQVYPPLLYLPLASTLELCHELEGGQMLLLVRDQDSGAVQVLVGGCLLQEVCPGCTAAAFHEPSRLLALYFDQSQLVELHQFAEDFSWVEFTGVALPVTVSEPWGGGVTVDGLEGGAPAPWMGFAEMEAEGGCGRMQGFESDTDETAYDETVLYGPQLHLVVLDRDGMAVLLYPVGDSFPGCQPPRAMSLGPCQLSQGVVIPGGSHLLLLSAPFPSGMPAQRHAAQVVSKAEALRCMNESGAMRQPLFLHVICLVTMTVIKELPLPFCFGSRSDWDLGISSTQEGALNIVLLQLSTGKLFHVPFAFWPQATEVLWTEDPKY